ncbi:MAG TPA: glycosyltransferase family 4 protein [Polyangiaceae bacterium]
MVASRAVRLVLVTQDFPPARGGIQTWSLEIARHAAARCEAFAVIAPRAAGTAEIDAALGFRVLRTGSPNTLIAACAPLLRRLVNEGFEHSLHANWSTAPAALALRGAGGLKSVAIMLAGRELLLKPWQALPPAQAGYDLVRRATLARADRLLPISEFTAGLARELGAPGERMRITPCGTDPERFTPRDATALRERLALGGRPVLLSITRLVKRKGLDSVLAALPQVREAVPEVAYVVVGDGPDGERLRARANELGVADRVHFVGAKPDDELPLWYALADVFVLPSRSEPPDVEGFGIVFLEAAAAERPVVAARAGGVPDAVADGVNGLLVAPDDTRELANALVALLRDPERRAVFGRRGRERVIRDFTWAKVAERALAAIAT